MVVGGGWRTVWGPMRCDAGRGCYLGDYGAAVDVAGARCASGLGAHWVLAAARLHSCSCPYETERSCGACPVRLTREGGRATEMHARVRARDAWWPSKLARGHTPRPVVSPPASFLDTCRYSPTAICRAAVRLSGSSPDVPRNYEAPTAPGPSQSRPAPSRPSFTLHVPRSSGEGATAQPVPPARVAASRGRRGEARARPPAAAAVRQLPLLCSPPAAGHVWERRRGRVCAAVRCAGAAGVSFGRVCAARRAPPPPPLPLPRARRGAGGGGA